MGLRLSGKERQFIFLIFFGAATRVHAVQNEYDTVTMLYIPLVVHIVSNNDRGRVDDDQIFRQIDVLNEDFGGRNRDKNNAIEPFRNLAANSRIQFYLASDEQGRAAIIRTSTFHGPFVNDDLHQTDRGGADGWDASKYLNIWVADLAAGVLGYGSSPGTATFKDGVAVHYEYFGRLGSSKPPYNLGRTATHEIGHWLGLLHPWGNGDCEINDGLSDTPNQDRPSSGCDLSFNSCGTLAMVQNFMANAFDQCMVMFTHQQAYRMRETLFTVRTGNFTTTPPLITAVQENADNQIQMYPNPLGSDRVIYLDLFKDDLFVGIFDTSGKLVYAQGEKNSGQLRLDLSNLSTGIYFARIFKQNSFQHRKIMIDSP